MAKYVMSDIHGCYNEFMEMIKKIDLKDADELYIIGDVIDRGTNPLEIIDYISTHANIHLLMGNHEEMAIEALTHDYDYQLWYMNGGVNTHNAILQKGYIYQRALLSYLKSLPKYMVIDDRYILCHAGLVIADKWKDMPLEYIIDEIHDDEILWTRAHIGSEKQYKHYHIICGHTPTQNIEDNGGLIIHREGISYIDCGCVFGGKLACLRLDDMKEFYIRAKK